MRYVVVKAYRDGTLVASSTTVSTGAYRLANLPVGNVTVCFDSSSATGGTSNTGYASECYRDVPWDRSATLPAGTTPVSVSDATTVTVDTSLGAAGAGSVSGTVTAASGGSGVPGVHVLVYAVSGGLASGFSTATTDASGKYTVAKVPPRAGGYFLCFDAGASSDASATGYQNRCYKNQPYAGQDAASGSTPVVVTSGRSVTGVDQALPSAGAIAGKVTDGGGAAVGGVNVLVYSVDSGLATGFSSARTGTDGTYRVKGLAGIPNGYNVCFDAGAATGPSATGYLDQCWKGKSWDGVSPVPAATSAVAVSAGAVTSEVNATLSPAGSISGTVTSQGVGVPGVQVQIYDSSGHYVTKATTGSSGAYTVAALVPAHSYEVCFDASAASAGTSYGYQDQCYTGVPWDGESGVPSGSTPVVLGSGTPAVTNVNATLAQGAAVSGTVVAAAGSAPLSGVAVSLFDVSGSFPESIGSSVVTSPSGTYRIVGVPNVDRVAVCFNPSSAVGGTSGSGYLPQCYRNVAWDGGSYDVPSTVTTVRAAPGTTSNANASLAAGASVSGTVSAATGGAPLGQVTVLAYPVGAVNSYDVARTRTAADGSYTIARLPVSAKGYAVCFDAYAAIGGSSTTGYADECYDDRPWDGESVPPSSATAVVLTAGQQRSGVNASLAAAGGIQGKVTGNGSTGVAAISVIVFNPAGDRVAEVATGADGKYTVAGLPAPAQYTVCFDASATLVGSGPGYLNQCYNGVAWTGYDPPSNATKVSVVAGASRGSVNATLRTGGVLTGTVTAASGGAGIGGVGVLLYGNGGADAADFGPDYYGVTAGNGTYRVSGLPADPTGYVVCFQPDTYTGNGAPTGYVGQCYRNVAWDSNTQALPASVAPVPLAAGQSAAADATLASGSAISGKVTFNGQAVGGVEVVVTDSSGTYVTEADTPLGGTRAGQYQVFVPPSATGYTVCFEPGDTSSGGSATGYLSRCYATPVTTTPGTVRSGINIALRAAGAVTGTVTSGVSGLHDVDVYLYDSSGSTAGYTSTQWDGRYRFVGLVSGSYKLCFDAGPTGYMQSSTGFVDECYDNVTWDGDTLTPAAGAKKVAVTAGSATTVNDDLARAAAIIGTVTAATGGAGVGGVDVEVFDSSFSSLFGAVSAADGTYRVAGLRPGSYVVCFDARDAYGGSSATGYLAECWNDSAWLPGNPPTGAQITLASGGTRTGIDAALTAAGAISGTVTSGGTALADVQVYVTDPSGNVFEASTATDGTYTVRGLLAGTGYVVCFDGGQATGTAPYGYGKQCWRNVAWNGVTRPSGITSVTVTAATATTAINAALPAAGAIAGTITSDGSPIENVLVQVYDSHRTLVDYASSDASGTYLAAGLNPSTSGYYVCFDADNAFGGPYANTCYPNQAWNVYDPPPNTAKRVSVTSGAQHDIDVNLGGTVTVSGTVASSAGAGLPGVSVQVYDEYHDSLGAVVTNSSGKYSLVSRPSGSGRYIVCFDARFVGDVATGGYQSECYNNVPWSGEYYDVNATPVAIPPGGAKTINATLASGGSVTGSVTATDGGAGLSLSIEVFNASGLLVRTVQSLADGSYSAQGLQPGTYSVCFDGRAAGGPSAGGYRSRCFGNSAWDAYLNYAPTDAGAVSVSTGSSHGNISVSLDSAGGIAGSVGSGSSALEYAEVQAFDSSGTSVATIFTDVSGAYTLLGLDPGSYRICVSADDSYVPSATGYLARCYDGVAWSGTGGPAPGAAAITLTAGQLADGTDVDLPVAAAISGLITEAGSGVGLSNVTVSVFRSDGSQVISRAFYGSTYTLKGLAAGSYTVCSHKLRCPQ